MKITKASEFEADLSELEEVIKRFEEELVTKRKGHTNYHLVIFGEFNRKICDEIEKLYAI